MSITRRVCCRVFALLVLSLAISAAPLIRAQVAGDSTGVVLMVKFVGLNWDTSADAPAFKAVVHDTFLGTFEMTAANGEPSTPQLAARLAVGKPSEISFECFGVDAADLVLIAPPGYIAEIDGIPRERLPITTFLRNHKIRVRPASSTVSSRAGVATALATERTLWQVSLGTLSNGESAGNISCIYVSGTPASLFTPDTLVWDKLSSEVQFLPVGSAIPRQILTPQVCVDVVTNSSGKCELKFYHRSQATAMAGGIYTFERLEGGGAYSPYAWYFFNQEGSNENKVTISCDLRPPGAYGSVPVSRKKVTTLERVGSAPNFSWTAQEWHKDDENSVSQSSRVRSGTGETLAVSDGTTVATQMVRTYGTFQFGEDVTSEALGSSQTITTDYTYYDDDNYGVPGTSSVFSRLRSRHTTGGAWEAYEYYDYDDSLEVAGMLKKVHRPFKDSSTTVPGNVAGDTAGEVTEYEYDSDAFLRKRRPTSIITKVGGTTTATTTIGYSSAPAGAVHQPNLALVTATRKEYFGNGSEDSLTTVTKYFREDAGTEEGSETDDFFRNQIHSILRPDGVKQSFAYERGKWDGTTFTPTADNGPDPTGAFASRISVLTGVDGSSFTTYNGYNIDDLDLVEGKSTIEVVIRDNYARVVRRRTFVRAANMSLIAENLDYTWNFANQLVKIVRNDGVNYGVVYEATYDTDPGVGHDHEHLLSEKDATGVAVSYTYDTADRVATATKNGIGVFSDLTTTFTYDGANRVTESRLGPASGSHLISSTTFDDAGRITSMHPAGLGTTSFSYNPASRSRTVTMPDTATRTEAYFADGQTASVSGSGVVTQTYDYDVEIDGRRSSKVESGGSARWRQAWTDWMGRIKEAKSPGFSPTGQSAFVETSTYDGVTGLLTKVSRTGYGASRYEYDVMGKLSRQGMRLGDDAPLDPSSTDRVADFSRTFVYENGVIWAETTADAYPYSGASAATAQRMTTRRQRLRFPANSLGEYITTDAEGNVTATSITVDRTTATVTTTTARTGMAHAQVETAVNGLTTSVVGHDQLSASITYDSLQRPWKTTDTRNNVTETIYYANSPLVYSVKDAANKTTTFGYDGLGRRTWTQDPTGNLAYFAYNSRGQLEYQWGSASFPVKYTYDSYGDRTVMTTYRSGSGWTGNTWPASPGPGDETKWDHDPATGLVWKKIDAPTSAHPTGTTVTFDYNVRGQTSQRTSARGLKTYYGYDPLTGELTSVDYKLADGTTVDPNTPGLTYVYTRSGQVSSVTQATATGGLGMRSFNYDPSLPWRLASVQLEGFYGNRILTQLYDTASSGYHGYSTGLVDGRPVGYQLGVTGALDRDLTVSHTYSDLGRFVGVTTQSGADGARDVVYGYKSDGLLDGYTTASLAVSRSYESTRDLVTRLEAKWGGASVTCFDYTYTSRGQRQSSAQSGSAFADHYIGTSSAAMGQVYDYDGRGELKSAAAYRLGSVNAPVIDPLHPENNPPSADELPGRRFEYRYDNLGNRLTAGPSGAVNSADDEYAPNALNQYETKENNALRLLGTATRDAAVIAQSTSATTVAVNKLALDRNFAAYVMPANNTGPATGTVTTNAVLTVGSTSYLRTDTRSWAVGPALQIFTYDADGNLTDDGVWTYAYDAESRVYRMTATTAAVNAGYPSRVLTFKYDYLGRRVQKSSALTVGATTTTTVTRYLYDGWNVIAEIGDTDNLLRSYTWGLDLAGTLEGAGGVGALLQIHDYGANKDLLATCDAGGNIAALVNAADGTVEATYEYSPFGELLRCEGTYAKTNPIRFSSKFTDDESGLVYYGARFYSPSLGRFINRDPIEEAGGLNLYGFCANDGVGAWDFLGMAEGGGGSGGDGSSGSGGGDGGGTFLPVPPPFHYNPFSEGAIVGAFVYRKQGQSPAARPTANDADAASRRDQQVTGQGIAPNSAEWRRGQVDRVLVDLQNRLGEGGSILLVDALQDDQLRLAILYGSRHALSAADDPISIVDWLDAKRGDIRSNNARLDAANLQIIIDFNRGKSFSEFDKAMMDYGADAINSILVGASAYIAYGDPAKIPGSCFIAGTLVATSEGQQPIEHLQVGDRVLTNDQQAEVTEVNPATWRKIRLRMRNPEYQSDMLDIELLRSTKWIQEVGCTAGARIWLNLEEMGLHGWADVSVVEQCPPIRSGRGRVVLATITHFNSFVMEMRFTGVQGILQPTDRHRLFSVTRNDWVPSAQIVVGERLATKTGAVSVESIAAKPGTHRVYNLEVETDHCYFAGDAEILSHNNNLCGQVSVNVANEKIVYRENTLYRGTIEKVKPFNPELSNAEQPVRAVRASDGSLHIMNGNNRVYGAVESGSSVLMTIYSPAEWEAFTGMSFDPVAPNATPRPVIRPGSDPKRR